MSDPLNFSQMIQRYITEKNETCDKLYEIINERISDSFTLKQFLLDKLKSNQETFEENLLSFERLIYDIKNKYNANEKVPMLIMMTVQRLIAVVNDILNNLRYFDSIIKEAEMKDYVIDYNEPNHIAYEINRSNVDFKLYITELQFYLE